MKEENKKTIQKISNIVTALMVTTIVIYLIINMIPNNIIKINEIKDVEYEYILKAMIDLKPGYINEINEITFSGNQTWIADRCKSENKLIYKTGNYLAGCHYERKNKIFIYVDGDERRVRETICHEILHEIMETDSDTEEELAYMIDDSDICYRETIPDFDIEIKDYKVNENSTIKLIRLNTTGIIILGGINETK